MARQALHRRDSRLPLVLRVVVALALAFLTLPLLNSPASADGSTTDVTTASPAIDTTLPPDGGGSTDPATTPVADTGSGTTAPATDVTTDPATVPVTAAGVTTDPSTTGDPISGTKTPKSKSSTSTLTATLAAPLTVSYDAVLQSALEAATYQPVDEQGANDEPGQKDLTRLWGFSPGGGHQKIGWNWDEIAWSGSNTGDGCALFDTDQDGNANFSVCVTVSGDPAAQDTSVSPRLYECTADSWSTKCMGSTEIDKGATTCSTGQTETDPFAADAAYPADTSALCDVDLEAVGGATTSVLTNVCSYPSQEPNSAPSDCVLAPRDALLTVKKIATPADGTSFDFTVTPSKGVTQDFAHLKSGEQFSGGVVSGTTFDLEEANIPAGWTLVDGTCDNGQKPASLMLTSGAHVTCTFTNTKGASVVVAKNWVINGQSYANGSQPSGYSASLTLNGASKVFGSTYDYTAGDSVDVQETATVPAGCTNTASGDAGTHTLAGGLNSYRITNTVTCAATVRVNKSWVINGVTYDDGQQPGGYSASYTLDGVSKQYGTEYGGFHLSDSVEIAEPDNAVTVPAGCTNEKSGDLGTQVLKKATNIFTLTNTVTCAATVTVDKIWVINGSTYPDGKQPTGYSAGYTLNGDAKEFGTGYADYVEGDKVTIDEPDASVTVPGGCSNVKSGDLGTFTVSKGDNSYSITNTVSCAATVRVNKQWVINGVTYSDDQRPAGYSAALTLDGAAKTFETTYSGYVQDQTVLIDENEPTIPDGCLNVPSGDLGTKKLDKGANVFFVTNTVTCAATVTVTKQWVINGVAYAGANPAPGYTATLKLDSSDSQFGTEYTGYREGEVVDVDESYVVPAGCTNVKSGDGSKTLAKGANHYTLTNTVTCTATVEVLKTWTINGTDYVDGKQPPGYSTSPTINGQSSAFGQEYTGFTEGQKVTIDEAAPDIPAGCTSTAEGTGEKTLAKGANTFTLHNTVDCAAQVEVDKIWLINGTRYDDGEQPSDYSGHPVIDGSAKVFGTPYDGYTEGDTVNLSEDVRVPAGCVNSAAGDTGDRVLDKGLNKFLVTNTVNCDAGLQVDKMWVVNNRTYQDGDQPNFLSAGLTINKEPAQFGTFYDQFQQDDSVSLDETTTIDNPLCTLDSAIVTVAKGNDVSESLPYSSTLGRGANGYEITNTVTCRSSLTLVKKVDYGTANPSDWTLSATTDQPGALSGPSGTSGSEGATADVSPDTAYVLKESGGPSQYAAVAPWACTNGVEVSDGTISVPLGTATTCTVHNSTATLVLAKTVANSNGGNAKPSSFTLQAAPDSANGLDPVVVTGSPEGVASEVRPGTTYRLTESSLPGYHLASLTCDTGDNGANVPVDSVVVGAGKTVTCTFLNVDEPGSLTLVKHVVNGQTSGTASPVDWTLSAVSGQQGISGQGGASGTVPAGTYTLSEHSGGLNRTEGYTASGWVCNGLPVNGAVTVATGSRTTCEITNTAVPGSWLVTKSSDLASGSTVQPGDTITYTVTAARTGGVDPTNVQVVDDLSQVLDHATLVSGPVTSTGTAAIDQSTQKLTWSIPALHGTETVTYTVRVDDGAWGVTLKNLVSSPGSDSCPQAQPDCHTTAHYTPAWALTKSSDPASGTEVQPGSDITYTLHAVNTSDTVVSGATAVDDLSKVLNHASLDSAALDPALSLDGTTLTWTLPTLAPGEEATVSYTVTVDTDAYDRVLANVVVPVGAGGICAQAADCRTSHPTGPQVLGEQVFRPEPKPAPRPPLVLGTPLPSTGAPDHDRLFGVVGATGLVLGACLMLADRRRRAMNR